MDEKAFGLSHFTVSKDPDNETVYTNYDENGYLVMTDETELIKCLPDLEWRKQKKNYAPFVEVEIEKVYRNKRKLFDLDSPRYKDMRRDNNGDIEYALNLHKRIIEYIEKADVPAVIDKVLIEVREDLRYNDSHIFSIEGAMSPTVFPTPDVFNQYIEMIHDLAVKLDDPNFSPDEINDAKKAMDALLAKKEFTIHRNHEKILGLALCAKNILVTQRPPRKNSYRNTRPMVVMFDYDHIIYPVGFHESSEHIGNMLAGSASLSKIVSSVILSNIKNLENSIEYNTGCTVSYTCILNYKEWVADFFRYWKERIAYTNNPDLFQSKQILDIIPMRIIALYKNHETYDRVRLKKLIKNKMIPDLVRERIDTNTAIGAIIVDNLYSGVYTMEKIRITSFREDIAPQIWDYAYFFTTITPSLDNPPKNIKDVSQERNALFTSFIFFQGTRRQIQRSYQYADGNIVGGAQRNAIYVARRFKTDNINYDRVGWYVGFQDLGYIEKDSQVTKDTKN